MLGGEVGQRRRAPGAETARREVEPGAVGVERGDEVVDAGRRREARDGDDRRVAAPSDAARRAGRDARAGRVVMFISMNPQCHLLRLLKIVMLLSWIISTINL